MLVAFAPESEGRPHTADAPPLTGDVQQIADALREYAAAGAHEVILVLDPITEESVRRCGEVLALLDA